MAQWQLNFRVQGNNKERILRAVSKVDPRPIRAVYEKMCVAMSFINAESQSDARGQQARIHDSLSKAINESDAIEFDPPQEVEAGAKGL